MLEIKSTQNHTGITISGDHDDLYALYDAIGNVIGVEGEWSWMEAVRMRLLGLNYDLRHAFMGDRELLTKPNGLTDETMRWHEKICPTGNTYYAVNILWPEAMFTILVLEDYIIMNEEPKRFKKNDIGQPVETKRYCEMKLPVDLAIVRLYQNLV